jgi:hypothetical protein
VSRKEPFGINDPGRCIDRWLRLHPSELFAGEFARFALNALIGPDPIGIGQGVIRFEEQSERFEVEVTFAIEEFAAGRIFHVLTIESPGDPPELPATD